MPLRVCFIEPGNPEYLYVDVDQLLVGRDTKFSYGGRRTSERQDGDSDLLADLLPQLLTDTSGIDSIQPSEFRLTLKRSLAVSVPELKQLVLGACRELCDDVVEVDRFGEPLAPPAPPAEEPSSFEVTLYFGQRKRVWRWGRREQ